MTRASIATPSAGQVAASMPSYLYRASSLGGADDAANFTGLVAGGLRSIQLAPGMSFAWKSPSSLVSGLVVYGGQGGGIVSSLTPSGPGGFSASCFYGARSNTGADNLLTADAALGASTISVTTAVTKGAYVSLGFTGSGNIEQTFRVLDTANAGRTLYLDDVVRYSYFTVSGGAKIYTYTPVRGVRLLGNGMSLAGPADRYVEVVQAWDFECTDWIVDNSGQTTTAVVAQFGIDVGCRNVWVRRCVASGGSGRLAGANGAVGFSRESSVRSGFEDCSGDGFTAGVGTVFTTLDAKGGAMRGCSASNSALGFGWGANDNGGTEGAEDSANALRSAGCTIGYSLDKASKVRISGMESIADATTLVMLGAGVLEVAGFRWVAPASGAYNGWTAVPGELHLIGGTIDFSARVGGNKAVCDWGTGAGVARMKGVKVTAAATGTYGAYCEDGVAQSLVLDDVDFGGAGTPVRLGSLTSVTVQQAGLATVSTTGGASTLSWLQTTRAELEVSGVLATDATVAVAVAIPGMEWTVRNNTSGAHTVTFAGITVAQGKTASVRINSAGSGERVQADT